MAYENDLTQRFGKSGGLLLPKKCTQNPGLMGWIHWTENPGVVSKYHETNALDVYGDFLESLCLSPRPLVMSLCGTQHRSLLVSNLARKKCRAIIGQNRFTFQPIKSPSVTCARTDQNKQIGQKKKTGKKNS